MNPTTIFNSLADFEQYANGLTANTTYEQLHQSIRTVTTDIIHLITAEAYIALRRTADDIEDPMHEGLQLLKTAVASGAMYRYAIWMSLKSNGTDAAMYKYQYEEVKLNHIEGYWKAMDLLLDWLDTNAKDVKWTDSEGNIVTFADSGIYKERQALPLKSAEEFDFYFGIDKSSFFFAKVQYLIREIWQMQITSLIRGSKDETVLDMAKRLLCYLVMAKVVMRFDVTEWPRNIRYDFNHEYTKGSDVQERSRLSNEFQKEANKLTESIEQLLAAEAGATAIQTNLNKEENKHYTIL
ncbi:MAG: hypothetical protein ACI3ZQ_04975 [Candidatus Cryptobacteroides sp.]